MLRRWAEGRGGGHIIFGILDTSDEEDRRASLGEAIVGVASSFVTRIVEWGAGCEACVAETASHVVGMPWTSNRVLPIFALVARRGFVHAGEDEGGLNGAMEVTGLLLESRG